MANKNNYKDLADENSRSSQQYKKMFGNEEYQKAKKYAENKMKQDAGAKVYNTENDASIAKKLETFNNLSPAQKLQYDTNTAIAAKNTAGDKKKDDGAHISAAPKDKAVGVQAETKKDDDVYISSWPKDKPDEKHIESRISATKERTDEKTKNSNISKMSPDELMEKIPDYSADDYDDYEVNQIIDWISNADTPPDQKESQMKVLKDKVWNTQADIMKKKSNQGGTYDDNINNQVQAALKKIDDSFNTINQDKEKDRKAKTIINFNEKQKYANSFKDEDYTRLYTNSSTDLNIDGGEEKIKDLTVDALKDTDPNKEFKETDKQWQSNQRLMAYTKSYAGDDMSNFIKNVAETDEEFKSIKQQLNTIKAVNSENYFKQYDDLMEKAKKRITQIAYNETNQCDLLGAFMPSVLSSIGGGVNKAQNDFVNNILLAGGEISGGIGKIFGDNSMEKANQKTRDKIDGMEKRINKYRKNGKDYYQWQDELYNGINTATSTALDVAGSFVPGGIVLTTASLLGDNLNQEKKKGNDGWIKWLKAIGKTGLSYGLDKHFDNYESGNMVDDIFAGLFKGAGNEVIKSR